MKSADPASLQNLNDIVLPATVHWWPLATGWYVLIGFLVISLLWTGYRSLRRWITNRYRREALYELKIIAQGAQSSETRDSSLRQVPVLLKRTALSAYPRKHVASLAGKDWHGFLNSTLKIPSFTDATAHTLDVVTYTDGDLSKVNDKSVTALLEASRHWLKHHQATTGRKERKGT